MFGTITQRFFGISLSSGVREILSLKRAQSQSRARWLHMAHGCHLVPHPAKEKTGGEDAAFSQDNVLIVADGISAWGLSGLSAGAYSRELVMRIGAEYKTNKDATQVLHPKKAINQAFMKMRGIGTTTICVVVYDEAKNELLAANIGDSGFLVYRPESSSSLNKHNNKDESTPEGSEGGDRREDDPGAWKEVHTIRGGDILPNGIEAISVPMGVGTIRGEIVCRSPRQTRAANAPRQLGTGSIDTPSHADSLSIHPLFPGDWIVAATDGVWDNLFEEQIASVLEECETAEEAAERVAKFASKKSLDRLWESPWVCRWRSVAPAQSHVTGGHLDDIGVVVGHITA